MSRDAFIGQCLERRNERVLREKMLKRALMDWYYHEKVKPKDCLGRSDPDGERVLKPKGMVRKRGWGD